MSVPIRTKTTLRAEWKEAQSATVVVTPRAYVWLTKERGGFEVGLFSEAIQVDGKRVRIERLTPAGWKLLQTVVVKSEGYGGRAEKDKLRFKVPKRHDDPRGASALPDGAVPPGRLQQPRADMRRLAFPVVLVPAPRWPASPRPPSSPTA